MPAIGIASTGTTLVGQSIGAGDRTGRYGRQRRNQLTVAYMGLVSVALALAGPWLLPLFIPSGDPHADRDGRPRLHVAVDRRRVPDLRRVNLGSQLLPAWRRRRACADLHRAGAVVAVVRAAGPRTELRTGPWLGEVPAAVRLRRAGGWSARRCCIRCLWRRQCCCAGARARGAGSTSAGPASQEGIEPPCCRAGTPRRYSTGSESRVAALPMSCPRQTPQVHRRGRTSCQGAAPSGLLYPRRAGAGEEVETQRSRWSPCRPAQPQRTAPAVPHRRRPLGVIVATPVTEEAFPRSCAAGAAQPAPVRARRRRRSSVSRSARGRRRRGCLSGTAPLDRDLQPRERAAGVRDRLRRRATWSARGLVRVPETVTRSAWTATMWTEPLAPPIRVKPRREAGGARLRSVTPRACSGTIRSQPVPKSSTEKLHAQ